MIENFVEFIDQIPGIWAFVGVIAILLSCGLGFPLPEEFPLFAAGYLAYKGHIRLNTAIFWSFLAILAGDGLLFLIGRKLGNRIFDLRVFKKLLNPARMRKVNEYFHRFGNGVVFLARFMAGVRATVFVTAGILQMPFRRFIALDGVAAMISAPLLVWLAFSFGDQIDEGLHTLRKTGWTLFFVLLIAVIGFSYVMHRIRKRKKKTAPVPAPAPATEQP